MTGNQLTEAQKSAMQAIAIALADDDDSAAKLSANLRAYEQVMGLESAHEIQKMDGKQAFAKITAMHNAAPDLVEALENLLIGSERHIFSDECLAERNAARAALAKAKGGAG